MPTSRSRISACLRACRSSRRCWPCSRATRAWDLARWAASLALSRKPILCTVLPIVWHDVMRRLRCDPWHPRSEQTRGGVLQATKCVVVEGHARYTPIGGQYPRLRLDDLRREDAPHRREARGTVEQ